LVFFYFLYFMSFYFVLFFIYFFYWSFILIEPGIWTIILLIELVHWFIVL
jgi:hypothetical protein